MPVAKIQAPDGRIITLEVPEGATQEQILSFVQSQQSNEIQPAEVNTQALQDLHSRQSGGEQITNEQFSEAAQGLTQEQQLQAFKAGRETTFDRAVGDVVGGAEGLATLATGAIATPVAGVLGAIESANPFTEEGAGAQRVQDVQEALTFQPRTEQGQQALTPVQALGENIESGKQFLGEDALAATGSPLLATISHSLPDAILSTLGLKTQGLSVKAGLKPKVSLGKPNAQQDFQVKALDRLKRLPANKKQLLIAESIKAGNPNIDNITKFVTESGDIVTSKASRVALKVLGKGEKAQQTVAVVERMNPATKKLFNEQLDIVRKGKFEPLFKDANRPGDVLGRAVLKRAQAVVFANKTAGGNIGKIAKSLKDKQVDIAAPRRQFFESLQDLGVTFDRADDGFVTPNFSRSKFIGGSQKDMNVLVNDLFGESHGFEFAHNLKRSIRDNLNFDKAGSSKIGKGTSENILKDLSSGIDSVLDQTSPKYNIANTRFAQTKAIADNFDKSVGKDLSVFDDLSAQVLADKVKRLTSNATSRTAIQNDLINLDKALGDIGVKFKDDIPSLIHVTNQLENIFDIAPQNSLQGNLLSAGRRLAQGDIPIAETAAIAKKALTASERKQFLAKIKALRDLANTNSKGQ